MPTKPIKGDKPTAYVLAHNTYGRAFLDALAGSMANKRARPICNATRTPPFGPVGSRRRAIMQEATAQACRDADDVTRKLLALIQ